MFNGLMVENPADPTRLLQDILDLHHSAREIAIKCPRDRKFFHAVAETIVFRNAVDAYVNACWLEIAPELPQLLRDARLYVARPPLEPRIDGCLLDTDSPALGSLGLTGKVEATDLRSLFEGYGTDGSPLVQNAGDEKRHSAWDLTFSAPKSVSTAWSQASPEVRKVIQATHSEAVKSALTYLEEEAAGTRREESGKQTRARIYCGSDL